MNRKYHLPETPDPRRKFRTDQLEMPAPTVRIHDSAPGCGDDLERPSRLAAGQHDERPPATALPQAPKGEFEFSASRPFMRELEDALRRPRNAPESAADGMSADSALPRPAPRTPFWEMPNGR